MELFNAKVYEKYRNLKKRKFIEEEEWNNRNDAELISYQSAVEEMIEALKNENERLQAELYCSQEQHAECKKQLLEEGKKSKELSDEVERLQNYLLKKNDKNNDPLMSSPSTTPEAKSIEISKSSSRQRTPEPSQGNETQNREAALLISDSYQVGTMMPDCCKRSLEGSGNSSEGCSTCIFQTLLRALVGMDFSVNTQTESLCLSVVHSMSGYRFSLTWIKGEGDESEWMYRASSLGTLERVASEWMKEEIIFSITMCRAFFERLFKVIGR